MTHKIYFKSNFRECILRKILLETSGFAINWLNLAI
jgi:hypothetical protein